MKEMQRTLVGQTFGKLLVIADAGLPLAGGTHRSASFVLCQCDTEKIVLSYRLLNGETKSCGCLRKCNRMNGLTHGHRTSGTATKTWNSWDAMKARCYNPKQTSWKNYGARGITVCERWLHSFENFIADLGERPAGTSIGRFGDEGNYEPGNCKWMTPKEQAANRRR